MAESIWVYTVTIPESLDADDFAFLLSEVDNEGIEFIEDALKIYASKEWEEKLQFLIAEYGAEIEESAPLENKNWNEIWESNFSPLYMEDILCIKADFHTEVNPTKYTIIVNPKMSFGTGHHPTTYMMLTAMNKINFQKKTVLDCGSGTGILAIYAEILGAKNILALDNDEWCYTNGIENIEANGCSHIQAKCGDIEDVNQVYDVILANIHRNYILEHFKNFQALLQQYSLLFASGFYKDDAPLVLNMAMTYNLVAHSIFEKENWCCIVFKKL
jgi:ribosomal protein L11 methyltransferase